MQTSVTLELLDIISQLTLGPMRTADTPLDRDCGETLTGLLLNWFQTENLNEEDMEVKYS